MHELTFAQQILDAVLDQAAQYPNVRVTRIKLVAPDALALDPASLRFCLEAIAEDTPAAGAQVEIEETGFELDCPECGRVPLASMLDPVCPHCGALGTLATSPELTIQEIELDEQDSET